MGEAAKLLDEERERVLRRYLQATAGRVPVVAGVSARATRMALDYARRAEEAGAAAVMLAPPDNTRNLDLVFEHFRLVAEAVSVPVVVQDEPVNTGVVMPAPPDNPGNLDVFSEHCGLVAEAVSYPVGVQDEPVNTGVVMPAPFLVRLLDEIEGCRYLKLEETPTLPKITAVKQRAKEQVGVFGGLGGLYLYEELLRGADGVMTGLGFPQVLVGTLDRTGVVE